MLNTHLEHAVDAEGVLELVVRDGVALVTVEMRKRILEPCGNARGKQPSEAKFEFKCDNVTVWTFMCESWPKVAQVVRSCLQNAEVEQFKMQVAKGVLSVRHRIAHAITPSFQ